MRLSFALSSNLVLRRVPIWAVVLPLLLVALATRSSFFATSCNFSMVGGRIQGSTDPCNGITPQPGPSASIGFALSHLKARTVFTERTVRQILIDIDQDGDSDLITLTNLPRVLVWVNDGTGHFTTWHASPSLRSSKIIEDADSTDADSTDEDTPLLFLWLNARVLSLRLVPLASAQTDSKLPQVSFDCLAQSSPRAPPLHLS